MHNVLAYIRRLVGWEEDNSTLRKRDRDRHDIEEERPALKRMKSGLTLNNSKFPMASKDDDGGPWRCERVKTNPNVRYVEIQSDDCGYLGPSTSTPTPISKSTPRILNRNLDTSNLYIPRELINYKDDLKVNSSRSNDYFSHELQRSPSLEELEFVPRRTPKSVMNGVDVDDKDDILVLRSNANRKPRLFIEHPRSRSTEIIEIGDDIDDDIVFVKRCDLKQNEEEEFQNLTSHSSNTKSKILRDIPIEVEPKKSYISKSKNIHDMWSRGLSSSGHLASRQGDSLNNETFKTPQGIMKPKYAFNLPQWLGRNSNANTLRKQHSDTNLHSRLKSQNAIAETFRLEEKQDYLELIQRMNVDSKKLPGTSGSYRSAPFISKSKRIDHKKFDFIDLTKNSKLSNGEINGDKEYDPFTIASINSSDSEIENVGSTADDASVTSHRPVHRVNSFKKGLEDKLVVKPDWLLELNDKYKSISLDRKKKIQEADFEASLINKINAENYKNTLAQKFKSELSFKGIVVEDISEEEVVLPELTEEHQKIINYILSPTRNPNETIVEKFRYSLKRRDLMTLDGLSWLNDEVINFYINLIMQRGQERKDLPNVFGINTFFYPKLLSSGHAGLKRWTRNVDIFAHDLMIVPVHLDVHWCMSIIDFREKSIKYYDSMGGANMTCCNALLKYLEDEHIEKKKQPLDSKNWKRECVKKIPHQMNGSDCGMFACTFAEYVCRNASITFTQKDMPYFRRKMVIEIKEGKLLI